MEKVGHVTRRAPLSIALLTMFGKRCVRSVYAAVTQPCLSNTIVTSIKEAGPTFTKKCVWVEADFASNSMFAVSKLIEIAAGLTPLRWLSDLSLSLGAVW
jgi:hypothetical protein